MPPETNESLGFDHLPQSQMEAELSLSTSPFLEDDLDTLGIAVPADVSSPEAVLRSLVSDNGLVSVLEALKNIMETQAERLQDTTMQPYAKQLKAFQRVAEDLSELIETLPAELDMEIALTQITHATPAIESTSTKLTDDFLE